MLIATHSQSSSRTVISLWLVIDGRSERKSPPAPPRKGQSQLAQHPHQIEGAEKERHGGRRADQRVVIGPLDDQQHAAERHGDGDKKTTLTSLIINTLGWLT